MVEGEVGRRTERIRRGIHVGETGAGEHGLRLVKTSDAYTYIVSSSRWSFISRIR